MCVGCGLAVEALARTRVPGALIPVIGLAAIVVVGQFLTLADATAELTTPVVAALALAGAAAGARRGPSLPSRWALAAAVGVFAVYAAPIVLGGEATFAGFIKLDDSATWMTFTDQLLEHGRDLDGLAPSTYEATLALNIGEGYPGGVFLPLGAGAALLGEDVAWLVQPYMAFTAALLALGLWELARGAVSGARARAAVAFFAAQPALLYGYYLWGGIKEVAAIALLAAAVTLAARAAEAGSRASALVPLSVVCAAVLGVLSLGGAIWLVPVLVAAVIVAWRTLGPAVALGRAAGFAALTAVLSLPVLWAGGLLPPTSLPLTDSGAIGNLAAPLDPLQLAGIWPSGDFRFASVAPLASGALIAVALIAATVGVAAAWRHRAWTIPCFVGGALATAAVIAAAGSPWVEGKAFATASVVVPFAALIGACAVWSRGRRAVGLGLGALVAAGVVWSNALAYRDVNLGPRDQLAELERIAPTIAGEGPTLMTEYSPYGARHFLRDADPEGVSELRRRRIPLEDGRSVPKGLWADTDALSYRDLLVYRTLVLRRSPAQSRPPSPYRLVWSGRSYEVWQRSGEPGDARERLALGSALDPTAVPRCGEVLALAETADRLLAARRRPPVVVGLADASYPASWRRAGAPGAPVPDGAGAVATSAQIPAQGNYDVWLRGSVKPEATLRIDGREVGRVRHDLNHQGQYVRFGTVALEPGADEVELELGGADLHPGSGGARSPIGPIVLSRSDAEDTRVESVPASKAESLCGHRWDWIEAAAALPE